jgi:serine/threonine-protein kinase HipA
MNGHFVGSLHRSASEKLELVYSDKWMTSEYKRSISLSLPVVSKRHEGLIVESYFDNLLPDNENIKRRIQRRFQTSSTSSFDILSQIGRDCVGAIQLLPEDKLPENLQSIDFEPLCDSDIAKMLNNYHSSPLGMDEGTEFRISIAGAQEKTALLLYNGRWCRPLGSTPTTHIIKLPIGKNSRFDLSTSVENEWLCHLILKAFGLPVADMNIVEFENKRVLAVKRFDRQFSEDEKWIIRLPQEDMCQALGVSPSLKYENDGGPGILDIMHLLLASSDSGRDRTLFMKSLFIFWLLGAIDGHGKNFSIFLKPDDKYTMTPLYDVMSAYPLIADKQLLPQKIKMAMAVRGKSKHYNWERIQLRHWMSTAAQCGFSEYEMEKVIGDVLGSAPSVISHVMASLPNNYPAEVCEPIAEQFIRKCQLHI